MSISGISGFAGLNLNLVAAKSSKLLLIANKESIVIAGAHFIKACNDYNTKIIPIDSEHNAISQCLDHNYDHHDIYKITLTASGGPFYLTPLKKFKNVKIHQALKHPNWKMGNKISIDSATMINKIYEVIEAKNIFNIPYSKIEILIHPKSYVHAIIKLKNGLTKIIVHDTTMKIPIFNSLYTYPQKKIRTNKIDFIKLNNLNFQKINKKDFNYCESFNPNKVLTNREKYVIENKLDIFERIYKKI